MTSAFDSFDASPLGARVQSAVDGTGAFAGGATYAAETTLAITTGTITLGQRITCVDSIAFSGYMLLQERYLITPTATPPDVIWVQEYHRLFFGNGEFGGPFFDSGVWQLVAAPACAASPTIKLTGQTSGATYTLEAQPTNDVMDGSSAYIADTGNAYPGATYSGLTSVNNQPIVWDIWVDGSDDVDRLEIYYPRAPSAEAIFAGWVDGETVDIEITF